MTPGPDDPEARPLADLLESHFARKLRVDAMRVQYTRARDELHAEVERIQAEAGLDVVLGFGGKALVPYSEDEGRRRGYDVLGYRDLDAERDTTRAMWAQTLDRANRAIVADPLTEEEAEGLVRSIRSALDCTEGEALEVFVRLAISGAGPVAGPVAFLGLCRGILEDVTWDALDQARRVQRMGSPTEEMVEQEGGPLMDGPAAVMDPRD